MFKTVDCFFFELRFLYEDEAEWTESFLATIIDLLKSVFVFMSVVFLGALISNLIGLLV
jgi:hypothetical protein